MENFNTYLSDLDMIFWRNLFAMNGELRHYKKGDYFCRIGEKTHLFGFIKTGIFKYAVTNSEGEERITGFTFDDTPVGDYLNLVTNSESRNDIVALSNAEVFVCNSSMVEDVLRQNPKLHAKVADRLLMQAYDRFLDLYRKSPKERYLDLLVECPEIFQRISLKDLASYLQITPTHLSRIRREITFENE